VTEDSVEIKTIIVYSYSPVNYSILLSLINKHKNPLIVSFDSPFYKRDVLAKTIESLRKLRIDHVIFEINERANPFVNFSAELKCYYCKSIRYSLLRKIFGKQAKIIDLEFPSREKAASQVIKAAIENNVDLKRGDTSCLEAMVLTT